MIKSTIIIVKNARTLLENSQSCKDVRFLLYLFFITINSVQKDYFLRIYIYKHFNKTIIS